MKQTAIGLICAGLLSLARAATTDVFWDYSDTGDTITNAQKPAAKPLPGYVDPKPMVFSGLYPIDGSDYPDLREALDRANADKAAAGKIMTEGGE